MSLVEQAKYEMDQINFGDEDSAVMVEILEKFFDQWDSGGAVWAVAPVLQRLIAGKCLSPLTGDDDEWVDVTDIFYQNKRISSVFKDKADGRCYDIDHPLGKAHTITFPYFPEEARVASPVVLI